METHCSSVVAESSVPMVNVLPEPVCPYANNVALKPAHHICFIGYIMPALPLNTCSSIGRAHSSYSACCVHSV